MLNLLHQSKMHNIQLVTEMLYNILKLVQLNQLMDM